MLSFFRSSVKITHYLEEIFGNTSVNLDVTDRLVQHSVFVTFLKKRYE